MLRSALLLVALASTLVTVPGCTPGSGAIVLESRRGRVLDRDSREPVANAHVFQVYWGRGIAGEPRPAYALRWTESGAAGAFAFDEGVSDEPRSWVLETDEPEYGFFHGDYGLVRAGPAGRGGSALVLEAPRPDAERHRAEMLSLCGARPPDAIVEVVRERHCGRPTSQR